MSSDPTLPPGEAESSPAPSNPEAPVTSETAPVAAPAAEASTSAPEATSAPAETPAAKSADAPVRPRVQLNPTADPSAKAVPSLSANDMADGATALSAETVPSGEPVEIPSKREVELDPEIEAEINQAMEAGDLPEAAPKVVAAAPGAGRQLPASEDELNPGTRLKGVVQAISGENIILEVGYRSNGCVQTKQFDGKLPEIGAQIDISVDKVDSAEGLIHCSLPKATRRVSGWDEVQVGQIVECTVTKTNKGGLEVQVNSLRGFLPAGQVDMGFVSSLEAYVNQKLKVKVTEVNPAKRNLVVSRRQVLEVERAEKRDAMWQTVAVGQTYTGTVKTIKDYGAFIDLGGLDGLLHVGEISWSRINHPSDVLKEGQQVEVQIVQIDREKNKVSLGMKQLQRNPWAELESRYPIGGTVTGRVTRTTDFGAFVELEPGIEGLIHISELEYRRVHRVTDVVQEGSSVTAKILTIDLPKRRIALSLKQMQAPPAGAAPKRDDVDMAPSGGQPYDRKRRGDLRGGTSGGGGSSRFG